MRTLFVALCLLVASCEQPLHVVRTEHYQKCEVIGVECHVLDDYYAVRLPSGEVVRILANGQPCIQEVKGLTAVVSCEVWVDGSRRYSIDVLT